MTTIVNEQICGTIDSTTDNINLSGEMRVSKDGILMSIQSGMIYDTTDSIQDKKYVGSFNVSNDTMNPASDKRSIGINITDITLMPAASTAIIACLNDIEAKYKVKA